MFFLNMVVGYCCIRLIFRGIIRHDTELSYIGFTMAISYAAVLLIIYLEKEKF